MVPAMDGVTWGGFGPSAFWCGLNTSPCCPCLNIGNNGGNALFDCLCLFCRSARLRGTSSKASCR